MTRRLLGLLVLGFLSGSFPAYAADTVREQAVWPQFRGPGGNAVGVEGLKYPVAFGKTEHLLWKTGLTPGNSSPCIGGSRIFLTGFDKAKNLLETLCIDRNDGRILWKQTLPASKLETSIHPANGSATPTPATDGKRVYVYFGSFGLAAYDFDGKEVWRILYPCQLMFASGSSPWSRAIGSSWPTRVSPCPSALDCAMEKRSERIGLFRMNYATHDRKQQHPEIVLARGSGVVAYDLKTVPERLG